MSSINPSQSQFSIRVPVIPYNLGATSADKLLDLAEDLADSATRKREALDLLARAGRYCDDALDQYSDDKHALVTGFLELLATCGLEPSDLCYGKDCQCF